MSHVARILIATLAFAVAVPAVAAADDRPYEPDKASPDQVLITERFDEPPLAFPWDRVSSKRLPRDGRNDFELLYDIGYDEASDLIREYYGDSKRFIELEPSAMRYVDVDGGLLLRGIRIGDDSGRLTVGHPDMESRFIVDFEADGSMTRFIILNQIRSRQFSGFVPVRVGFQPDGLETIPMRHD